MSTKTPDITLYFLQASRSMRIAWLLEELGVPYKSIFYPRENNKAPSSFKSDSGNALAKAPALRDGDLMINESGAITEYLIETYDKTQHLLGGTSDLAKRNKIRMFIHAAEGTFAVHALSITYLRWFAAEGITPEQVKTTEKGLAINVVKDLDWLENELKASAGRFLVGDSVTAADTMVAFSVQFIFARDLCGGRKLSEWKGVEKWIGECEGTDSYKRAVEKTGHKM